MTSRSHSTGQLTVGERDLVVRPRRSNGVGVLACHGAGGDAAYWGSPSERHPAYILGRLAKAGFTCWAGDFGGMQTWGNDVAAARMEAARVALIALGCDPAVVLIGASMGHLNAVRYAADHPTLVRAIIGLIPAVNIEEIRSTDAFGTASDIEAAWSLAPTDPIPARGIPLGRTATVVAAAIPWRAYYGEQDTVTDSPFVRQYATALGQSDNAIQIDNTGLEHSPALFQKVPADDLVEWVLTNAT